MDRKIETIKKQINEMSKSLDFKRSDAMQAWREANKSNNFAQAAYEMGLITGYADGVTTLCSLIFYIDAYVNDLEGEGNND